MSKIFLLLFLFFATQMVRANQKDSVGNKPISASLADLAFTLCRDTKNEQERVENIFRWIAYNISHEAKSHISGLSATPKNAEQILKTKTANPQEYAILMKTLCEIAGIRSMIIEGYHKNEFFTDSFHFYTPNHAWNALFVNQKWQFADAYLGAGNSFLNDKTNKNEMFAILKSGFPKNNKNSPQYNPEYLLENPQDILKNRIPADPIWQMMEPICSLPQFENAGSAGQNVLKKFNHYSNNSEKQDKLYKLSQQDYQIDAADRIYHYNTRYIDIRIKKYMALAQKNSELYIADNIDLLTAEKSLLNLLDTASFLVLERKKEIPRQYLEYRKILLSAKSPLSSIRTSLSSANNKYVSLLHAKQSAAQSKMEKADEDSKGKISKLQDINPDQFLKAKTLTPQKTANDPIVKLLSDSIQYRTKQISKLKDEVRIQRNLIAENKILLNNITDSLIKYFYYSDSLFLREVLDNHKFQVGEKENGSIPAGTFLHIKTLKLDSLQKSYFNTYDTLLYSYEKVRKNLNFVIEASKKTTKDLESLKRNREETKLTTLYNAAAQDYSETIRAYVNHNLSLENFLKDQIHTFDLLKKRYLEQNELFELHNTFENNEKDHLKKLLLRSEEYDEKQNTEQGLLIAKTREKIQGEFKKAKKSLKEKNNDSEQ